MKNKKQYKDLHYNFLKVGKAIVKLKAEGVKLNQELYFNLEAFNQDWIRFNQPDKFKTCIIKLKAIDDKVYNLRENQYQIQLKIQNILADECRTYTKSSNKKYTQKPNTDDGFTCKKCNIQSDDVHECMNCDIHLCVDCDENEMPLGADDHTYCTPCVSKLFTDADYEKD